MTDARFSFGPVSCDKCWRDKASSQEHGAFRLVRDPGYWGSANPRMLILGMSKGNTQSNAYLTGTFEKVAFAGIRPRLLQILQSITLLADETPDRFERRFCEQEQDLAFASVVRCSLTGWNNAKSAHTADSPVVVPAFKQSSPGFTWVSNCVERHLASLPSRTELVILLGNTPAYMKALRRILDQKRGPSQTINDVAFRSNGVLFVHVGHPSKGNGHFNAFLDGKGIAGGKRDLARAALTGVAI